MTKPRGRPKKSAAEKRSRKVRLFLTEEEYELLREIAELEESSVSRFALKVVVDRLYSLDREAYEQVEYDEEDEEYD